MWRGREAGVPDLGAAGALGRRGRGRVEAGQAGGRLQEGAGPQHPLRSRVRITRAPELPQRDWSDLPDRLLPSREVPGLRHQAAGLLQQVRGGLGPHGRDLPQGDKVPVQQTRHGRRDPGRYYVVTLLVLKSDTDCQSFSS